jgi:hypothetical protein
MALPIGPWGKLGAGLRTGPARTIQQGMMNQAKLDMFRDASRSIEAAPQLSPGQAWAQGSMNELQMRNMGMSRAQLQARNEQARLRQQTAELAHSDQAYATVKHLSSLLPEQSVVPHLSEPTQGIMRNILGGARTDANNMLNSQPIGGERPGIGPLTEGTSIPQMLERVRNQIAGVMQHDARIQPTADQALPIRQAAQRVQANVPGAPLEPLWQAPAYRGPRPPYPGAH